MNSTPRHTFEYYFGISILLTVLLFFLPYLFTYNAPAVDGSVEIGFPLAAYSYGGWCIAFDTCPGIIWENLVLDVLFILAVSIAVSYFLSRKK